MADVWVDLEPWADSEPWMEPMPWIGAEMVMTPTLYAGTIGVPVTRTSEINLWVTEPETAVIYFAGWGIPI